MSKYKPRRSKGCTETDRGPKERERHGHVTEEPDLYDPFYGTGSCESARDHIPGHSPDLDPARQIERHRFGRP